MTDKKYRFFLVSDRNSNSIATDRDRLTKVGKALRDMGHKTVYIGVGPNKQWSAPAKGCTGENDVLLVICSGLDAGVCEEWGGSLGNYWRSKFKKAHPFMIKLMSGTERRTVGDKKTINWGSMDGGTNTGFYQSIGRAWDANYGYRLSNPANYCKQHGISFLQGGGSGGISDVIARLKKGEIGGAGLQLTGVTGSEKSENKDVTVGFNTSTPFQAYLKVGYVVRDKNGNKSKIKYITIDWSEEAPDTTNKWSNTDEDKKDISLSWVNNRHTKFEIELLSKIQSVEGKFDTSARGYDTNQYIIKTIDFCSYTQKSVTNNKKSSTNKTDESLIYDPSSDQSTHKMLLYNIGFFNGDIINPQTLGVSAKSLLDGINTVLNETNYLFNMSYGDHRESDALNFRTADDNKLNDIDKLEEFNEFINGNIIGLSNITFSPVSDMCNTNLLIYKTVDNAKKNTYHHARTTNLDNLLRYGELSKLNKSDTVTSYAEARQKSYDDYLDNFNTQITYTATITGLPYTQLNDYIQSVTLDSKLSGAYRLCSKTIHIDTQKRPMIRTDCGLGAIDKGIAIYKNLEKQRKDLVKFKADINEPISYEGEINLLGE